MGSRFGHDFRQVRIHTDARAAESARALGANAFAVDNEIFFGSGQYAPGSSNTDRLLAHELTHVVQQAQSGPGDWARASNRADSAEREAELASAQVLTGQRVSVQAAPQSAIARDEAQDSGTVTIPEVTVVGDERAGLAHKLGFLEGQQGFPTHRSSLSGEVDLLTAYDEGFNEGANAPRDMTPIQPPTNDRPDELGPLSPEDFERDKRAEEERELERKAEEQRLEFIKELSQELVE